MTASNVDAKPFAYWTSLILLLRGERVLYDHLDLPLRRTTLQSRYTAFWTGIFTACVALASWVRTDGIPSLIPPVENSSLRILVLVVTTAVIAFCAGATLYGILRLYTLVLHNLTTNLFKVRGQRLRLLSALTTSLSLSVPLLAGYVISWFVPVLGWLIVAMVGAYAVILLARAYNVIFHTKGFKGLWILVGGTLVTCFVLAIGALAIAVAVSVALFLVLLLIRGFHH